MYDTIIVGGGPAGLSAALVLGRCRRRVLLCDAGHPRNAASHAMHGFLSRDGIAPAELLRIGREQLRPYDTVELRDIEVTDLAQHDDGFEVTIEDGSRLIARKVLLATGVADRVPAIKGIEALYGRSVFHCPYCDGWEVRDQPLAIYGRGAAGRGLALELTRWSRDLVLCTDGSTDLSTEDVTRLSRHGISICDERIACLEGRDGMLERIVFANGDALPRRAMFFNTGEFERCDFPAKLGCLFDDQGTVQTDENAATNIPGLYIAGDASQAAQFAIVAAAEGAEAAEAINTALLEEETS